MTADERGRLAARLRRLETQVRAFRDLHGRDLAETAERLAAIAKVQADELQMILDELTAILASAEEAGAPELPDASLDATTGTGATVTDPAAASPKRAKWLAEQARSAQMSRRDLLRGRERP